MTEDEKKDLGVEHPTKPEHPPHPGGPVPFDSPPQGPPPPPPPPPQDDDPIP